MSDNLEQIVLKLAKEVRELRAEVAHLKSVVDKPPLPQTVTTKTAPPVPIAPVTEPITQSSAVQATDEREIPAADAQVTHAPHKPAVPQKPKRSFEEKMTAALPRLFMIILVLGVLWGLKLVNDYGILTDAMKITLSFMLSFAFIGLAVYMEKKRTTAPIMPLVFYGGAFIIGILATAAATIIYEMFPLSVALFIALLYIAYGIFISYVRENQTLTLFVACTSLLLPYLLQYMAFNRFFILGFILLLFAALQIVIVKHRQRIALHTAYVFSVAAMITVGGQDELSAVPFALGLIASLFLFVIVWWRLYEASTEHQVFQEGFMFSLSSVSILLLNAIVNEHAEWYLLVCLLFFVGAAFFAHSRSNKRTVDLFGTIALLTLLNTIIVLNISESVAELLLPLHAFIGFFLALKLRASFMKIIYTIVFYVTVLITYIEQSVEPFWSLGHLNLLLILLYMVILFVYAHRNKLTLFAAPLLMTAYFFGYVLQLEWAYVTSPNTTPYVLFILIAALMLASWFAPKSLTGRALPYLLVIAATFITLDFFTTNYVQAPFLWLHLTARLVYIGVALAVVADFFMEGKLYQKLGKRQKNIGLFVNTGIIVTLLLLFAFLSQLQLEKLISRTLETTGKTAFLFAFAGLALWLTTFKPARYLRTLGLVLLPIAVFKLIFVDLATLDLVIRTVLFLIIGGVGLVLSNKLLKKDPPKE